MTFSQAAKDKAARLGQHAKYAIEQYNKDVAKGGDPAFPDWAMDLLALLDSNERLALVLSQWNQFAINNAWDDENCTFMPATRAALHGAGVVIPQYLKQQADIWHPSKPESAK